jgi:hypothetical protein
LERIFRSAHGDLPAELASYLLKLDFPPDDHARYQQLCEMAQRGVLSKADAEELDALLIANDVLSILQSKARASLKRHNPAA